jgi:TPR repeat protein
MVFLGTFFCCAHSLASQVKGEHSSNYRDSTLDDSLIGVFNQVSSIGLSDLQKDLARTDCAGSEIDRDQIFCRVAGFLLGGDRNSALALLRETKELHDVDLAFLYAAVCAAAERCSSGESSGAFLQLAWQGHPVAQYAVVVQALQSRATIDAPDSQLVSFLEDSVSQGFILSNVLFSALQFYGQFGLDEDADRAWVLIEPAIHSGIPIAYHLAGQMHFDEENFEEAIFHFERAIEAGVSLSKFNLAWIYWLLATQGDQSRGPAALSIALEALDDGFAEAGVIVGSTYYWGLGVEADVSTARKYWERSLATGTGRAEYYLGRLYAAGEGVEKDIPGACKLFDQAARYGFELSFYQHGLCLIRQDRLEPGYEFIERAAGFGIESAVQFLQEKPLKP